MAELSGIPANHALERAHEALFLSFVLGEARYRPVDSYSLGMSGLPNSHRQLYMGPS